MALLLAHEREQICRFGRKLLEDRLTRGTSGNLSICNREAGLIAISPSGLDYLETTSDDIVILDLDGNIVEEPRKPSSEHALHRFIYQNRDDVSAVVHTHSTFATVLSCLGWDLPAVHYMLTLAGENVRCSRYATFGTEDLARNALEALADRNAVFLANHGFVAAGANLTAAYAVAIETEFCAELYWRSRCVGEPVLLEKAEMKSMKELFQSYGQKN
jgi:L-fuculose-phosphate aldolase